MTRPLLAVLLAVSFLAGCSSVYHKAGKDLGPDIRTRLATRIREARTAAATAEQALLAPDGPTRADEVEEASWEFSKRVASVHDVAERLELTNDPAAEVLAALDKADKELSAASETMNSGGTKPPNVHETVALAISRADAYLGGQAGIVKPKPSR